MLRWLKAEGYGVVLILTAEEIDEHALVELGRVSYKVEWLKPPLRTRFGRKFPQARQLLWEPLKVFAHLFSRRTATLPTPDSLEQLREQAKSVFAPARLLALVHKLARKYRPSAVIVEYIFSTPVFSVLPPGTLKIVDTIDVFSRKEEQVLAYGIADPLACSWEEERQFLLQADAIVAIQSREAEFLKALAPERTVLLAGLDFDVTSTSLSNDEVPGSVAVIASDNALNVHGLNAFLSECWPIIKATIPSTTLHVIGRVGDSCRIDDPSIRYSGWVSDLDKAYSEASVIINPTIAGTGLKIKSVQALAHGKPLVAWPNGVEGLLYAGDPPFVECRSWLEFASAVVHLLQSDSDRVDLASRALAYAQVEFSADTVYASLREYLDNAKRKHSISPFPYERRTHSITNVG